MTITLGPGWVAQNLPKRANNSHKGTYGTLNVVAGSRLYRGAALLAVAGALRSGTGIVRLCATEPVCAAAAGQLPTCILQPLAETAAGGIAPEAAGTLPTAKVTATLAGPGLGNTAHTAALVHTLLQNGKTPIVLDADALNALAGHLDTGQDDARRNALMQALRAYKAPVILTPHVGEMGRLCGEDIATVETAPEHIAAQFATRHGCTVVLKSHTTTIATPAGELYRNTAAGNPGLAKGGSGDVLAGIIAGLLAQRIGAGIAAAAGVWLHAAAGDVAAARYSMAGLSPTQLPDCLCEVWQTLKM